MALTVAFRNGLAVVSITYAVEQYFPPPTHPMIKTGYVSRNVYLKFVQRHGVRDNDYLK